MNINPNFRECFQQKYNSANNEVCSVPPAGERSRFFQRFGGLSVLHCFRCSSRVYVIFMLESTFTVFYVVFTDVHSLLVLVASSVVLLACLYLLIRAFRRRRQCRGKQRELQRPFIKGKRVSLSPRKNPLLLGSLVSKDNKSKFWLQWCHLYFVRLFKRAGTENVCKLSFLPSCMRKGNFARNRIVLSRCYSKTFQIVPCYKMESKQPCLCLPKKSKYSYCSFVKRNIFIGKTGLRCHLDLIPFIF